MVTIIGVCFRQTGKIYYFDPNSLSVERGQIIIVETARGLEIGTVVLENREVDEQQVKGELKKAVRIATEEDLKIAEENKRLEENAFKICEKKIAQHGLDMKLIGVEYSFDRRKILFSFSADGRVDFRNLVKDLAYVFKTRIELRQIGPRDEARIVGGLGVCGRPFCCKSFLGDFSPVTVKMAKEQSMSLSPVKISGTCGRLMCCLKYEQEAYEHLLKITPKNSAIVETPEGRGVVVDCNLLTGMLKVRLDKKADAAPISVHRKKVKLIKDSKIKVDKKELDALKDISDK